MPINYDAPIPYAIIPCYGNFYCRGVNQPHQNGRNPKHSAQGLSQSIIYSHPCTQRYPRPTLGALNRAKNALAKTKSTFGIGLEGGLVETPEGVMTCAWCAMVDSHGKVGYGGGVHMLLPPQVVENLHRLGELGPAMDVLVNEHNTKQGRGAVGILTRGLSSRQAAYEQLVAMAAAPFVTEFYHD